MVGVEVLRERCFSADWVRGVLAECVAAQWDPRVCEVQAQELAEALAFSIALLPGHVVCDPRSGQDRNSELLGRAWVRVQRYGATFLAAANPWGPIRTMLRREAGTATACAKRGVREDRHHVHRCEREVPVEFPVLQEIAGVAVLEPEVEADSRLECLVGFLCERGMGRARACVLVGLLAEVAASVPESKRHTVAAQRAVGEWLVFGFSPDAVRAGMSLLAGSRKLGVESSLLFSVLYGTGEVLPVHEKWAARVLAGEGAALPVAA